MTTLQAINKIATSKTVNKVYVNGSKMMEPLDAIAILSTIVNLHTKISVQYKVNTYRMGDTWEDLSTMIVTF